MSPKVKDLLLLAIIIPITFAWSSKTPAEVRTIIMRGNSQVIQDDRPPLLKASEDWVTPIVSAIIKPMGDSMQYIVERQMKEIKLENEFRRLYKPTQTCRLTDKEETKQKCKDLYIEARTKYAKEKALKDERQAIIRSNNEEAIAQARTEAESFKSIYKKPAECYDTKNSATRIKCANDYMRARAAFSASNR